MIWGPVGQIVIRGPMGLSEYPTQIDSREAILPPLWIRLQDPYRSSSTTTH